MGELFCAGIPPNVTVPTDIDTIVQDIADILKRIDSSRVPFKSFQPGVGPYGEPQLMKLVANGLNSIPRYEGRAKTMRTPDLLIEKYWALEIKLARPFGDNGKPAENWSVNLLHPYSGNTSLLGDCLKLQAGSRSERKGVIAVGYEHDPAQVSLEPLWKSFELIASTVLRIPLGPRVEAIRDGLAHPVHQRCVVVGWKIG
jgi:hypothetical protein